MKAIRDHLASIGRPLPIYLQEENRRYGDQGPTQAEFIQAAVAARDAGAAGWVFHSDKAFDLSGGKTWLANLDGVERATVDALGAALSNGPPRRAPATSR